MHRIARLTCQGAAQCMNDSLDVFRSVSVTLLGVARLILLGAAHCASVSAVCGASKVLRVLRKKQQETFIAIFVFAVYGRLSSNILAALKNIV